MDETVLSGMFHQFWYGHYGCCTIAGIDEAIASSTTQVLRTARSPGFASGHERRSQG